MGSVSPALPPNRPTRTYLDHAATTPVRPEVAEQVARDLVDGPDGGRGWANPAALYTSGRRAAGALADARARIAAVLDADPHEVVLTSGGTEACSLALTGRVLTGRAPAAPPARLLVSAIEHPAVLDTARTAAAHLGAQVTELPVGPDGVLDLDALDTALTVPGAGSPPELVSVALASHETGALQPVAEAAARAHAKGAPVHTDAVAAVGRVPVSFRALGVDALSLAGHKLGAPVGVGALVLHRDLALTAPTGGGRQERGLRSGTQDAVAARALALALELARAGLEAEATRLEPLRTRLLDTAAALPGVHATLPPATAHLPGTAHLWCEDADGEALLMALDLAGIDASAGSACHAGVQQPSHVLLAMGLPEAAARATLRISMGRTTTAADVEALLAALPGALVTARRAHAARRAQR